MVFPSTHPEEDTLAVMMLVVPDVVTAGVERVALQGEAAEIAKNEVKLDKRVLTGLVVVA